ncbi:Fcf2 pre-rRNA processing-domain-containing protein [Cunninghamella echinulata]|nr:Fcf2 pre-rRNA processing-domain-containing protein [Cunninghamella echinulata]
MTLDDKKDPYKEKIFKLPKLNAGVDPEEELYIKDNATEAAKLISDAVSIIEPGKESSSTSSTTKNKSLITLKKVQEESKPLSRKERQLEREKTAGKGWFDMPRTEITPELKRDLEILKMRHILDRKRHYKKMGKNSDPKYFQVGTVIEGATEFFSARINKKDRKRTFVDEILSNDEQKDYYRNKYLTSQTAKSSGGKKHYKKLKAKRSL